jgi:hypothetical protein
MRFLVVLTPVAGLAALPDENALLDQPVFLVAEERTDCRARS